jgi:endonuclease-8
VPEGDTLFRIAETLRGVLVGQTIVRVRSSLVAIEDAELVGHVVVAVEARGKNLLVTFDDGRTLHTHLRMMGRWLVYPVGRAPRVPADVRVALETDRFLVMCTRAPVVRLLTATQLRRDERLRAIGPDLLGPAFSEDDALSRLQRMRDAPLAEALLDQRVMAGIGNVYKSELCFIHRLDPFAPVSAFTRQELSSLIDSAKTLLAKNAEARGPRRTRQGRDALWVYDRAGKPCLRCAARVRSRRGERVTYFCDACQPAR